MCCLLDDALRLVAINDFYEIIGDEPATDTMISYSGGEGRKEARVFEKEKNEEKI